MGFVYLMENKIGNEINYKIGYTKNLKKRLTELNTGNPGELKIIKTHKSLIGLKIETIVHRYLKTNKIKGEWFKLDEKIINDFNKICETIENNYKVLYDNNNYYLNK